MRHALNNATDGKEPDASLMDLIPRANTTGDVEKAVLEIAEDEGITFDMAWVVLNGRRQFTSALMSAYDYSVRETKETELQRAFLTALDYSAAPYADRNAMKEALGVEDKKTLDSKKGAVKFHAPMQLATAATNALFRVYEYHKQAMCLADRTKMLEQIQQTQLKIFLDIQDQEYLEVIESYMRQFVAHLHEAAIGRTIDKRKIIIDKRIDSSYNERVRQPLIQVKNTSVSMYANQNNFRTPKGYSKGGMCLCFNLHMGTTHVAKCTITASFHVKKAHNCLNCGEGFPHPIVKCPVLRAGFRPSTYQPTYASEDYSKEIHIPLPRPQRRTDWQRIQNDSRRPGRMHQQDRLTDNRFRNGLQDSRRGGGGGNRGRGGRHGNGNRGGDRNQPHNNKNDNNPKGKEEESG